MKIKEILSEHWWQLSNEHVAEHANYKLHVAVPIKHLDKYYHRLRGILKKAIEDGVIQGFKILNIGSSETILKSLGNDDQTIHQNPALRLYHNPITIYLYKNFNPNHVVTLCQQIERELQDIPGCDARYLSSADIPILPHISIRQEKLAGAYVAIAHANQEALSALKEQLMAANEFKLLTTEIDAIKSNDQSAESTIKAIEKTILGFYISSYDHFNKTLHAKDSKIQFRAACDILQIDHEKWLKDLTQLANANNAEIQLNQSLTGLVAKEFRKVSSRFHPDKLHSFPEFSKDIFEKSTEIFKLVNHARTILDTIISKPELILESESANIKGLGQEEYVPHYEYELVDGYKEDPYFYANLAKSDKYVQLKKNWEIEEIPVLLSNLNPLVNNGLQIYQKQKKYYGKSGKIETVPGYEAFYKLWQAKALAARFNHYEFIFSTFSSSPRLNVGQRWLAVKALTNPDFACQFSIYDLKKVAIKATREGVLNVGNNEEEVFWYLYRDMPEIISNHTIKSYFGYKLDKFFQPLMTEQDNVVQKILAAPNNLKLIAEDALKLLCEHNKAIRKYVYTKPEFENILKNTFSKYDFIEPLFKASPDDLDEFDQITMAEFIGGNRDVLSIINTVTLEKYKAYILKHAELDEDNQSPYILPSYLVAFIENEMDQRKTQKEDNHVNSSNYQNLVVKAKKIYLSGRVSIAEKLSTQTLIWLATEPEITWEYYLPIARSLVALGQHEIAKRYLNRIATELKLAITSLSAEQMLAVLTPKEAKMVEFRELTKEEKIKNLFTELNQQINAEGTPSNGQSYCIQQLEALGEGEAVTKLFSDTVKPQLQKTFHNLVARLKAGEKTDNLKHAMQALQANYKRISALFGYISPWGWQRFIEETDGSIFGHHIFCLFEDAIGVTDTNVRMWRSDDRHEKKVRFGIDPNGPDLIALLRDIYYLYDCFGFSDKFYVDLVSRTKHKYELDDVTQELGCAIPDYFDEKLVQNYLSKYARNELTVFADGNRENAFYKTWQYRDDKNIKQFNEIKNLYKRLGIEAVLNEALPQVFDRILQADQAFLSQSGRKLDYQQYRPFHRYREIVGSQPYLDYSPNNVQVSATASAKMLADNENKTQSAKQHPTVYAKRNNAVMVFSEHDSENKLAILNLEYALYTSLLAVHLNYGLTKGRHRDKFLEFRGEIITLYNNSLLRESAESIQPMLTLLANFLDSYPILTFSDAAEAIHEQLLNSLKKNSVLCHFFNLNEIEIAGNAKSISHALAKAIKAKTYKLNPVPSNTIAQANNQPLPIAAAASTLAIAWHPNPSVKVSEANKPAAEVAAPRTISSRRNTIIGMAIGFGIAVLLLAAAAAIVFTGGGAISLFASIAFGINVATNSLGLWGTLAISTGFLGLTTTLGAFVGSRLKKISISKHNASRGIDAPLPPSIPSKTTGNTSTTAPNNDKTLNATNQSANNLPNTFAGSSLSDSGNATLFKKKSEDNPPPPANKTSKNAKNPFRKT